jgi:hypothetical protein
MSPVRVTPVKSSLWSVGEDESERSQTGVVSQHRRSLNNRCCAHHHGGVGGRGMPEQAVRLKVEVCDGGRQRPSARTSVHDARRACAAAEVGAARSSNEGGNDAGAKEPRLNTGNEAARDESMASKEDKNVQKSKRCDELYGAERRGTILPKAMRRSVHGKPDARKSQIRFDEGWGTQCCSQHCVLCLLYSSVFFPSGSVGLPSDFYLLNLILLISYAHH